MRFTMIGAVLAAAAMPSAASAVQTRLGYTAYAVELHAGPLRDFPSVRSVRDGAALQLHGCLRDWSWCDVTYRSNRGWIAATALRVSETGHRRGIAAGRGIAVTSFLFEPYWASNYRSRAFYDQRQFWQNRYERDHRPEWGKRYLRSDGRQSQGWSVPGVADQEQAGLGGGDQAHVPMAPYAFPSHAFENLQGKDSKPRLSGPMMTSSAQDAAKDSGVLRQKSQTSK